MLQWSRGICSESVPTREEHKMTKLLKSTKLAASIAAGALALMAATSANADQILGYAQTGVGNTTTLDETAGVTTITSTDAAIVVANYAGGGAPFLAFITLSATS